MHKGFTRKVFWIEFSGTAVSFILLFTVQSPIVVGLSYKCSICYNFHIQSFILTKQYVAFVVAFLVCVIVNVTVW